MVNKRSIDFCSQESYDFNRRRFRKEGVTAKVAIGGSYGNATHRDIICKFSGAELESNNGEMTSQIRTNIVGQPEAGEYEGTITYAISCVPNT